MLLELYEALRCVNVRSNKVGGGDCALMASQNSLSTHSLSPCFHVHHQKRTPEAQKAQTHHRNTALLSVEEAWDRKASGSPHCVSSAPTVFENTANLSE